MTTTKEILSLAASRAPEDPYAGAVTPDEAYALLTSDERVKLIDVRTNAERDWVGRVDLPAGRWAAVEWSTWPGGVPNAQFGAELAAVAKPEQILLFLCRSGVRSRHAARVATELGFTHAYDILEGFEGDKNAAGHRKTVGGWCHRNLPWLGA